MLTWCSWIVWKFLPAGYIICAMMGHVNNVFWFLYIFLIYYFFSLEKINISTIICGFIFVKQVLLIILWSGSNAVSFIFYRSYCWDAKTKFEADQCHFYPSCICDHKLSNSLCKWCFSIMKYFKLGGYQRATWLTIMTKSWWQRHYLFGDGCRHRHRHF